MFLVWKCTDRGGDTANAEEENVDSVALDSSEDTLTSVAEETLDISRDWECYQNNERMGDVEIAQDSSNLTISGINFFWSGTKRIRKWNN